MKTDDNPFSETGIWNVAVGYSFDILMYHIYWMDRYEILANHGAIDFNQEIELDPEMIKDNRLKGINWFYTHLCLLVSNSKFAIQDKDGKNKIGEIDKQLKLKEIKKYLAAIKAVKIDQKRNITTISINEELFGKILDMLTKLKEELFPILYRANLVFQYKENYSPEEMKAKFMERMTNYG